MSTNHVEVEVDAFLYRFLTDEHREEATFIVLHDEVAEALGTDLGHCLTGIFPAGVGLGSGDGEFPVHVVPFLDHDSLYPGCP